MTAKSTYFPSLFGLRFFAFLSIFLHNLVIFSVGRGRIIPEKNSLPSLINNVSWIGVEFFFVLSGFLITFKILEAETPRGSFSLKNFWLRRILRIAPLYYLALFVGFFLLPFIHSSTIPFTPLNLHYSENLFKELPFYLFFAGNFSTLLYGPTHFIGLSHLWTTAITMHFYIVWPLIFLLIRDSKYRIYAFFLLIALSFLGADYIAKIGNLSYISASSNTLIYLPAFAVGGLITLFNPNKLYSRLRLLFNVPIFLVLLIVLIWYLNSRTYSNYSTQNLVDFILVDFYMAYIIILFLESKSLLQNLLNTPIINWLGKISYSLYIWHVLVINLVLIMLPIKDILPLAFVTILISIIISFLSYSVLENLFSG